MGKERNSDLICAHVVHWCCTTVWCYRWEEPGALSGARYLILILETSWQAKIEVE